MTAYYNEHDPYAAQWLRNLIAGGHIPSGFVDERSIEDVLPSDLIGFTQCHFFAGIGVWPYALRRAGWPDDRPVWTASCPCQPFSSAGVGAGFDDSRHLWPAFAWLAWQHGPTVVFGEQVASKNAEPWVDLVQADMEALGYAFGAVAFPAAGVGAPHIRDRLYWVAEPNSDGFHRTQGVAPQPGSDRADGRLSVGGSCSPSDGLGHASGADTRQTFERTGVYVADGRPAGSVNGIWADADWLSCRDDRWRPVEPGTFPLAPGVAAGMGRVQPGLRKLASRNRTGRLKGYGNALNAEAAIAFIGGYLEA